MRVDVLVRWCLEVKEKVWPFEHSEEAPFIVVLSQRPYCVDEQSQGIPEASGTSTCIFTFLKQVVLVLGAAGWSHVWRSEP